MEADYQLLFPRKFFHQFWNPPFNDSKIWSPVGEWTISKAYGRLLMDDDIWSLHIIGIICHPLVLVTLFRSVAGLHASLCLE